MYMVGDGRRGELGGKSKQLFFSAVTNKQVAIYKLTQFLSVFVTEGLINTLEVNIFLEEWNTLSLKVLEYFLKENTLFIVTSQCDLHP